MSTNQEDKSVRVKFITDMPGVRSFNDAVNSMTSQVKKLNEELKKTITTLEGFAKTSGKTRGGNVGKSPTQKGAGIVAETIIGDPNGVKNAAKATETALAVTGASIRRFVDNAVKDLTRLRTATGGFAMLGGGGIPGAPMMIGGGGLGSPGLLGAMPYHTAGGAGLGGRRLLGGIPTTGWMTPYAGGRGGQHIPNNVIDVDFEEVGGGGPRLLGAWRKPWYQKVWDAIPGGSPWQSGDWWSRVNRFGRSAPTEADYANSFWGKRGLPGYLEDRGEAAGRMLGLGTVGQSALGRAGRFIGSNMGVMGGLAVAGVGLYEFGANSFEKLRAAQVNYTLGNPFARISAGAAGASVFNRVSEAAMRGNASYLAAYNKALATPAIMKMLSNEALNDESINLATGQTPLSLSSHGKYIFSQLQSAGGMKYGDLMQRITGAQLNKADESTLLSIAKKQAQYQLVEKHAEQLNNATVNIRAMQGSVINEMSDSVVGNAAARYQALNMAGLSTGRNKAGNFNYETARARAIKRGFDIDIIGSGHQGLLGIGYGGAFDPITFIGDQIAGFRGIGQTLQLGGILGGGLGGARGYYSLAQQSMGANRLNSYTGSQLFPGLANAMLATGQFGTGNTGFNYAGLAAGLVGGIEDGKATMDSGEQQRMMQLLLNGNKSYNRFFQGQAAPLYDAASLLSAIGVTGKYDVSSQALSTMSTELLTSIARGGKIPNYYAEMPGVNKENAIALLQKRSSMLGLEAIDSMSSSPTLAAYRQYGNDPVALLNAKTKGLTGRARRTKAQEVMQTLAGQLANTGGPFSTPEEAESTLLATLAGSSEWASAFPKGGGVHSRKPRGEEGDALKATAEAELEKAKLGGNRDLLSDIKVAIEGLPKRIAEALKGIKENTADTRGNIVPGVGRVGRGVRAATPVHGGKISSQLDEDPLMSVEAPMSSGEDRNSLFRHEMPID